MHRDIFAANALYPQDRPAIIAHPALAVFVIAYTSRVWTVADGAHDAGVPSVLALN